MHIISYLVILSTLLVHFQGEALPFGSRLKDKADEVKTEEEGEDVNSRNPHDQNDKLPPKVAESSIDPQSPTISIRGALSATTPHRNSIVDSFFAAEYQDIGSSKNLPMSIELRDEIKRLSSNSDLKDFLTSIRRKLHRRPEVMYQEAETSQVIQDVLTELDITFTTGWGKNTHQDVYPGPGGYGVVADIGTGAEPCLILRADIDALPIDEKTAYIDDYKSSTRGKMHACGHDGHTTMLLGAAFVLKTMETSIKGTVRLIFQPAEEGGAGAKRMVEEGVVEMAPKAELAFGMHVWPTLPSGTIASKHGVLMAASDKFQILIAGKGGHAAMPHLTHDPIVTASSLIMNLQTIVSRSLSPLEEGVVSVTSVVAGDAFNVIPASATLKGTIRSLSTETLDSLRTRVEYMVHTTTALYGCNATITYSPDFYPPTFNDVGLFEEFSTHIGELVSKEGKMRDVEPTMGGEDFSFLAQQVPSTFFFVGQGSGGDESRHLPSTSYGLHHPHFALDENILPVGVELHTNLALRGLKKLASERSLGWSDESKSDL